MAKDKPHQLGLGLTPNCEPDWEQSRAGRLGGNKRGSIETLNKGPKAIIPSVQTDHVYSSSYTPYEELQKDTSPRRRR